MKEFLKTVDDKSKLLTLLDGRNSNIYTIAWIARYIFKAAGTLETSESINNLPSNIKSILVFFN